MTELFEYEVGGRKFLLDKGKAKEAFEAKRVICGRNSPEFNVMPLKYNWAYEIYRDMEANHWLPQEVPMYDDIRQWNDDRFLSDRERNIIRVGIGYFCSAEGIVGDCAQTIIRENLTAPELKLAVGRHVQEENIHTESLLYMISSLRINPHEVSALFLSMPSVIKKNQTITKHLPKLRRELDLTQTENKQLFAKTIFGITQIMEGTQFFGLFLPILHLQREGKMPGMGQMFRYTMRDESNHIELGRKLFLALLEENPDILTPTFKQELIQFMRDGIESEVSFVDDLLPQPIAGLSPDEIKRFVRYNANRRLMALGWEPIDDGKGKFIMDNPFPWSAEAIYLKKNENFFETTVTEYGKLSNLQEVKSEEELFEGIEV
ncbi:MAG: ribonucleotide-diphosphate reductase subunit beta [Verrucomicrobia bacterium]|nr:ribonucleotide-diphosphate reductase subunit beta [Verrucomicrobiota bacterium]